NRLYACGPARQSKMHSVDNVSVRTAHRMVSRRSNRHLHPPRQTAAFAVRRSEHLPEESDESLRRDKAESWSLRSQLRQPGPFPESQDREDLCRISTASL